MMYIHNDKNSHNKGYIDQLEALQMHEIELYLIQNGILQQDKIKPSFNIKPF